MAKKETKVDDKNLAVPTYVWANEEGEDELTPVKRKIAKTMEVTETFNYYDALKYVMQLEKAKEDKLAEIEGLDSMIKAYRDEIEIVEKALNVTEIEKEWNLELHRKLKEEEVNKLVSEGKEEETNGEEDNG